MTAPYSLWREGGDAKAPFIVCGMFTPNYLHRAERLLASLESFGLRYALFEVATIHRSISIRGEGDLALSKPRFIRFLLERFDTPVLYLDCDVVLRKPPKRIASLAQSHCDFAIYNWLADDCNDAWRPEPGTPLWKFYFRVDLTSQTQLMASGAVQFWRGTQAAFNLLTDWEQSLRNHPRSEDDQCLDFAYNHGDRTGLKPEWLPKSYCRYAYWIYAQPIIDHPQFPQPLSGQFHQLGSERFDRAQLNRTDKRQPFPRALVIDVSTRKLLKQEAGESLTIAGPLKRPLYLPVD